MNDSQGCCTRFVNRTTELMGNRAFFCKLLSMGCCITASVLFANPVLIFGQAMRVLIPSFMTGYIIVNLAEMIVIGMRRPHVFVEMLFDLIGIVVSLICGFVQLYKWIYWFIMTEDAGQAWIEMALGGSCLMNAAILLIDLAYYIMERYYSKSETED